MKDVDYMAVAETAMAQIQQGAFLTVKAGDRLNTMTIGWATIGYCWKKPIFMVAVRDSRHTFTIIEDAADFTVSVPSGDMKKEVLFCGTKSGRDMDKFAQCDLKTIPGRKVASPIIDLPGIHFECRIVYKSAMDPARLTPDYEPIYPAKDYHTLYFGEILDCYEI
ncbi:MAG: flavin reductase family protein [Desulfobacterales bacterium]|nr:flavin reductase family protein [Desulfobacterales bacterium]